MPYIEAFLLPVPKKNLSKYLKLAREAAALYLEHGALQWIESVVDNAERDDDLRPKGKFSFSEAVERQPDETLLLSWIVFDSLEHRDLVNEKVNQLAQDQGPEIDEEAMELFDIVRMIGGGFNTAVMLPAG